MLRFEGVTCGYGLSRVVHGLDLEVRAGEIVALLGPNGAGKTSTIMCAAGHVSLQDGRLVLDDYDISSALPMERVRRGIALSPEGRRLFTDLSVEDNLRVGAMVRPKAQFAQNRDRVLAYFPRLAERLKQSAGRLSGGEQQMLALGRALMAEPAILLIDELSLGLMPKATNACYLVIKQLAREGLGVLVVEQNTAKALGVADRVLILESGRVIWSGSGAEARENRLRIDEAIIGGAAALNRAGGRKPRRSS